MILGSLSLTPSIIGLALAGSVSLAPTAMVRGDVLRLADIADVSALPAPLRDRAGSLALMTLPDSNDPLHLRGEDIASRARSLLPALAPWLTDLKGKVVVTRRNADPLTPWANATRPVGIRKGDSVQVTVSAGIYKIERQGIAMSDVQPGDGLFVKTKDGKAVSVMCCGK
jgi:hypothetical protein